MTRRAALAGRIRAPAPRHAGGRRSGDRAPPGSSGHADAARRRQHAPPVGVAAVHGGLHEHARTRWCARLARACSLPPAPRDPDDQQLARRPRRRRATASASAAQTCARAPAPSARFGTRCRRATRPAGRAVGQQEDAVVGARVAVDRERVERVVEPPPAGVSGGLPAPERRIGRDHRQHRGHVRMDHAGALGHAADGVGASAGRTRDGRLLRHACRWS